VNQRHPPPPGPSPRAALSSFTYGGTKLDLLDALPREKLEGPAQATDDWRDRFGFSKNQFGGSMTNERRETEE
jgi:hypothetical protein